MLGLMLRISVFRNPKTWKQDEVYPSYTVGCAHTQIINPRIHIASMYTGPSIGPPTYTVQKDGSPPAEKGPGFKGEKPGANQPWAGYNPNDIEIDNSYPGFHKAKRDASLPLPASSPAQLDQLRCGCSLDKSLPRSGAAGNTSAQLTPPWQSSLSKHDG